MKISSFFPGILVLITLLFSGCQKDEIGPTQQCLTVPGDYDQHPKAEELQSLIDHYTQQGLPGISLLIRDDNGRWAGASGMADIDRQIRMEPCQVSKIASVTKLFVGVLVMQLVEEDVLQLDAPITNWLPEKYTDKVANAKQVTLRQLLNHTSGIYDLIDDNGFYLSVLNDPAKFWKPDELIKFVYGKEAAFAPGTDVGYSNTNLLLAAVIIEEATGRSHAQLIKERIIHPLSLTETYYHWHDPLPAFVAQGYYDLYNNGTIANMTNFNTGSGNGYGGMYANVFDMQRFIEALLREKTLLSEQMLQEMTTITSENIGRNIAFGVAIRKDFLDRATDEFGLGHRGRDLAYSADLYYFPTQDITMAYLVNYGTDAESSLQQIFFDYREDLVDLLMKD